jgi:hypothetical protein
MVQLCAQAPVHIHVNTVLYTELATQVVIQAQIQVATQVVIQAQIQVAIQAEVKVAINAS